jgi:hypothetical protein
LPSTSSSTSCQAVIAGLPPDHSWGRFSLAMSASFPVQWRCTSLRSARPSDRGFKRREAAQTSVCLVGEAQLRSRPAWKPIERVGGGGLAAPGLEVDEFEGGGDGGLAVLVRGTAAAACAWRARVMRMPSPISRGWAAAVIAGALGRSLSAARTMDCRVARLAAHWDRRGWRPCRLGSALRRPAGHEVRGSALPSVRALVFEAGLFTSAIAALLPR